MLDKSLPYLIVICALLSAALWWTGRAKPPGPIHPFDVERVASAALYVFKSGEYIEMDVNWDAADEIINDSLVVGREESQQILTTLLDGMHYVTPDYAHYKGEEFDADMAMCHDPHFILRFYDEQGHATNNYSICFMCSNVYVLNGYPYPNYDQLNMSPEGELAFMKLEERYFPEFHKMYLATRVTY